MTPRKERERRRSSATSSYRRHSAEAKGPTRRCVKVWNQYYPFLNLLFILPAYRGKGYGTGAMAQWEQEMKKRGFKTLLISTQVDESAQFFYRKLGYVDCGGLVFQGTPFSQPMEMFMRKVLD